MIQLLISDHCQFLADFVAELLPILFYCFEGIMVPKHVLNSKDVLVAFADLLNWYIPINHLIFLDALRLVIHIMFLVLIIHFSSNLINLSEGRHVLLFVFEEGLQFEFEYVLVGWNFLFHPHTNLLYSFIDPEIFVVIIFHIELWNWILEGFEDPCNLR